MIIFDLDGTLWDSAAQVAESWNLTIEKETGQNIGLTAEDISRNMGKNMDEISEIIFAKWPKEERAHLSRCCETEENAYITVHGGNLYDGVRETLAKINSEGVPMAVVSNCQQGYIKAFLDSMNMHDYFCDYEEWGRTGRGKDENIRLVMERNGADKAVYVGDIQNDANAAHAAGIPCIFAAYGFGDIEDAEGRIDSFEELPEILTGLGYL